MRNRIDTAGCSRRILVGLMVYGSVAFYLPFVAQGAPTEGSIERSLRPAQKTASSPQLLARGKQLYLKQCADCHGPKGDGEGRAAYLLYPKPRDFTANEYRLVSSWDGVPSDEDLFYSISRGLPGSAMPPWAHLPEADRWSLVHYLKTFSGDPLTIPDQEIKGQQGLITVPKEPSDFARKSGYVKKLYLESCAQCHGNNGKGDGVQEQKDSKDRPTRPRDFTLGIFKGDPDPQAVYRRLMAGMPGTPMPSSQLAYGDDGWYLTRYVLSLSTEAQRRANEVVRSRVAARKVPSLPAGPETEAWKGVSAVDITLLPLWWRGSMDRVQIQAVHDGKSVAFRLSWKDAAQNDDALGQNGFTDGAALQFSEDSDPPLFAMGAAGAMVNIWHWKASWEKDALAGRPQLASRHPNMPDEAHAYPGTPGGKNFQSGEAAGNPLSKDAPSVVEDLNAKGFGTLTNQGASEQNVKGKGVWENGTWSVMFTRELASPQKADVAFNSGKPVSISMAVWDGQRKDRNGQKSVSIWNELVLEK